MITILVPAYNEEDSISDLVFALRDRMPLSESYEILVVNDGSTDATQTILETLAASIPTLRIVNHPHNMGLGCALRSGFRAAQGRIIVTMDADLTHPPELIPRMLEASDADVVIASRYVRGGGMASVPWWRAALSVAANAVFRLLFATKVRDITAGFKAYHAECVRTLEITSRGFEAQLEITIRLVAQGATFREIPYVLTTRQHGASKMRYLKLISTYLRTVVRLFVLRWRGK
jgi:dolichol-phosphate mannosyltransferase